MCLDILTITIYLTIYNKMSTYLQYNNLPNVGEIISQRYDAAQLNYNGKLLAAIFLQYEAT